MDRIHLMRSTIAREKSSRSKKITSIVVTDVATVSYGELPRAERPAGPTPTLERTPPPPSAAWISPGDVAVALQGISVRHQKLINLVVTGVATVSYGGSTSASLRWGSAEIRFAAAPASFSSGTPKLNEASSITRSQPSVLLATSTGLIKNLTYGWQSLVICVPDAHKEALCVRTITHFI